MADRLEFQGKLGMDSGGSKGAMLTGSRKRNTKDI